MDNSIFEFIPRHILREYLSSNILNKYAEIDDIKISSFISRCERNGYPVPYRIHGGSKSYRMVDVIAKARAFALSIKPPLQNQLEKNIEILTRELEILKNDISVQKHILSFNACSTKLTGATLLTEQEIIAGKLELPKTSGVYFLLNGNRVVYVGQSVLLFSRVMSHLADKKFDGFAYIPCKTELLDKLESLYIHALRPELNGYWTKRTGRQMCAPIRIDELLAMS